MAVRPNSLNEWASDPTWTTGPNSGNNTKTAPTAGEQAQGNVGGLSFKGNLVNYEVNRLGLWVKSLDGDRSQLVEDVGIPLVLGETTETLAQTVYAVAARTALGGMELSAQGTANWLDSVYDPENDLYIIVGSGAEIETSPRGATWTARTTAGTEDMYAVAVDPSGPVICVVGDNSEGYTSPDGVTWTQRSTGGDGLFGIAFGNGNFVAVGDDTTLDKYYYSADGITWNTADKAQSEIFHGIAYNGTDLFVAVGQNGALETSATGTSGWTARTSNLAGTIRSVAFAANGRGEGLGLWCAVGDNGVITSPDGITWTNIGNPRLDGGTDALNVVRHLGDRVGWLIGGDNGATYHGSHPSKLRQINFNGKLGGNEVRSFASPHVWRDEEYAPVIGTQDSQGVVTSLYI